MRQLKITKQVTNRETASLDKYLQEIGKVDLITADEEVELAQKIKAGDQRALEKLTKANLRFVVSVAKQYQNQGLTLPDLINEGNLGLIKAAQRFDETRGFKFISYAVWWIRQSILQALAEQSRIPRRSGRSYPSRTGCGRPAGPRARPTRRRSRTGALPVRRPGRSAVRACRHTPVSVRPAARCGRSCESPPSGCG